MRTVARLAALGVSILFASFVPTHAAHADGLQFSFISPTDQSVVVGSSLTQVSFDGFVTNDSLSSITFALITPSPESPFVASVMSPFPFLARHWPRATAHRFKPWSK
jgi:hypothetical protein